ncbi:MAG: hypothetical protein CMK07_11225 [Ponticaulis sp.]|nr:hypothetical protein [Ponticaulis sp.]
MDSLIMKALPQIKKLIASTIVSITLASWGAVSVAQAESWTPSDGEVLKFDVLRKGKPFGYHTVEFDRDGDTLNVTNDIELKVSFGPIRAFYYKHDSVEAWADGKLVSMEGSTRKDGDDLQLDVDQTDQGLDINGSSYDGSVSAEMIPSSHWNKAQMAADQIFSSEDGSLLDIDVTYVGEEEITAAGETLTADRYTMASELSVDLWYDKSGRWVKCAFEARGETIEYVLTSS